MTLLISGWMTLIWVRLRWRPSSKMCLRVALCILSAPFRQYMMTMVMTGVRPFADATYDLSRTMRKRYTSELTRLLEADQRSTGNTRACVSLWLHNPPVFHKRGGACSSVSRPCRLFNTLCLSQSSGIGDTRSCRLKTFNVCPGCVCGSCTAPLSEKRDSS